MKPELQHIALLEALGWQQIEVSNILGTFPMWLPPNCTKEKDAVRDLPPLTLDLMHEAEETLNADQCWTFNRELSKLQGTAGGMGDGTVEQWPWHATVAQRLEAFLKTKGFWKDELKAWTEENAHREGGGMEIGAGAQ